jgi:hypothetical protein
MTYLFIHDENNKENRDKLDYTQSLNLPNLNIIKMLDAQYMFNFTVQGVPTLLIFSDNSPAFASGRFDIIWIGLRQYQIFIMLSYIPLSR